MADTKITALTAITTVDPAADVLPIVDVSDTSMAASGTTKKITSNQILGAGGTATLASATITGDLTVATSVLKVDTANTRVGINTTSINGGPFNVKISPAIDAKFVVQDGFTTGNVRLAAVDNAYSTYKVMDYSALSHAWYNSGTTAMTLNSTGLGVGVVPSAGKGALQLSSGINFPATQVASSDANTLDDYEEGTWTPSVGGTATYTTQTGRYVKIGNRVFITLRMTINTIGTGDDYRISGLPFQPAAVLAAASVGFFANLKISANFISGYASTASSVITMTGTTAASANITNGIGVFGNGSDIVMSCFYEI